MAHGAIVRKLTRLRNGIQYDTVRKSVSFGPRLFSSTESSLPKAEEHATTNTVGETGLSSILRRLQKIDIASLCDADKSLRQKLPSDYAGLSLMNASMRLMTDRTKHHTDVTTTNLSSVPPPRYFSLDEDIDNDVSQPDELTETRMVGIARTVRLTQPNDFLAVLQGLHESRPGEVLVVDTLESTRAVAGGLFVTEAHRRGLAGMIVDGPVRDVREMNRGSVFPCFATGVSPYSGTVIATGRTQVPVTCAGVTVRPGDVCLGDGDGIAVASPEDLRCLIDQVEQIQHVERRVIDSMRNDNRSLFDMINFEEHLQRRREGKASALEFK